MNDPSFANITSPSRWMSPEEKQVAVLEQLETVKARTNSNVLDYEANDVRLSIQDTSGQFFPRVKMYMRETGFLHQ
jgi:hypothetical protein